MTFITVLVQHAWAMQPAGATSNNPKSPQLPASQKLKRIPTVRVSIPSTVSDFVQVFNQEICPEMRQNLDTIALDVLSRLEDLVLASKIIDPQRKDPMRHAAKEQKQSAFKKRISSAGARSKVDSSDPNAKNRDESSNAKKNLAVRTQTRRYAAQARRSLLALATARSRVIRAKCIALLIEALDTNELGADDGEVASLLLLVKELGDVLEGAIEARRIKRATAETETGKRPDQSLHIPVDEFLEQLAICIGLAVQRLEYACDIKSFFIPGEVQGAFQRLFNENLLYLETDDPFITQVITSSIETIHWLMMAKVESEELMATPVALSLLSQITRMSPNLEISDKLGPFSGILNDLKEKQEWHLGYKFLKLLAAGTSTNEQACQLFLGLIKQLDPECWQWSFCAIMCLGATVLTTESSTVRKIALEQGLLVLIEKDDKDSTTDDYWRVRAAAAICLGEIYLHNKSDSIGLLAHEALRERREIEQHPKVQHLLTAATSFSNHHHHPRRVSFLFKYVCLSLAETYAESQSRYTFLRKFLNSTHKKPPVVKTIPSAKPAKPFTGGEDTVSQKQSKFTWNSRNLNLPDPKRLSKRANDVLKMVQEDAEVALDEAVPLSVAPYHQNYKQESKNVVRPSLLTNNLYKTGHELPATEISNPKQGTLNRRKLFHAMANDKNQSTGIQIKH
ncbi:hypothetical protein HDU98_011296 [Podochytrium sp. JEL0797]|nr:hypothetical protein HDU98_011296 [Podochytrium sp. JEL0797]